RRRGGYPTPGGYPPPSPQGGGYPPQEPYGQSAPPNYLIWSIVTIFLSAFLSILGIIPGIVAIVYASRVKPLWAQGLYDQARSASKTARTWAIVSTVLIVIGVIAIAILFAIRTGTST
ncbi:MAG: CD225/dispanin family protein, partial [Mycobacterium sp.]